jgi:hypothetical protein
MERLATRNFLRAALVSALAVETVFAAGISIAPVRAAGTSANGLLVSVGYAEDKETNNPNPAAFPVPWQGSPNTIFIGGPVVGQTQCGTLPSCFDAGAIRLDNPTAGPISVSDVSVDIHSSMAGGKVFDLWGSFLVPAGQSVILTENPPGDTASFDDFDTSGYPGNQCSPITLSPTVTITVAGVATTLFDSSHVLDTGGIDLGFCGSGGIKNESIAWRPIGSAGAAAASLNLAPSALTVPVGGSVVETATLLDGGGNGLANVPVAFAVVSGPNTGHTGAGTTDGSGHATFNYGDSAAGTDIVTASVTTLGTFSTQALVTWGTGTNPTWTGQDIGNPPIAGSDSTAGGVWTISGSGRDIGGTADQFHFVSQPIAGDGEIDARVVTQTNSNSRARAGVMLRQSTDASAPFYAALVTPGAGIWVLLRASPGGAVTTLATIAGVAPVYLRVGRTGSSVIASTSTDGTTWTPVSGSAASFGVSGAVLAGLAVTSHTATKSSSATFDSVNVTGAVAPPLNDFSIAATPSSLSIVAGGSGSTSVSTALVSGSAESIGLSLAGGPSGVNSGFGPASVSAGSSSSLSINVGASVAAGIYQITVTGTAPSATHSTPLALTVTAPTPTPTPTPLPTPTPTQSTQPNSWLDTDVGAPLPAGSATFASGLFTVNGSGADIFGTSDQFNYVYQPTTGNGTIIARVTSQSITGSSNSKAGIIWKASTTSGSPYILIETGPTGAVKVQYNFTGSITTSTYTFPNLWMKLVRSGSNFSAFVSPDGVTWTSFLANKSLPTIPVAATVGIFECSHKPGTLGTATFDNVSFTPGP